jgi:hypothetical protein
MPRIIEKTVYTFDELSDDAKEKARDWWREGGLDYDWWDSSYDDFATIATIFGIDLKQKAVRMMNGKDSYEPAICFSGFWNQGDGASFEGRYSYMKGAPAAIRAHAPKDETLHSFADRLQAIQKPLFYRASAIISTSGNYCHSHTMSVDCELDGGRETTRETDEDLLDVFRDFADWMYRSLEKEHEYLTSDESVDETIKGNEYEFTEEGRRAC